MLKPWLIFFSIAIAPVYAHEFWLQPMSYTGQVGNEIAIDWRVGSHFEGTPYVYLPSTAQQVAQIVNGKRQDLNPRFAAKPALTVTIGSQTTIAITQTTDFEIKYADKAAFVAFLAKEQLQDSIDATRIAESGEIIESYRRYAKTLITSSKEPWRDQVTGLDYEWLITARGAQLSAQLLSFGEPAQNHPVKLFEKSTDGGVHERVAKTNDKGVVSFDDMQADAVYLLNAIRIAPVEPSTNEFGATWHTEWASTTFQWPSNR